MSTTVQSFPASLGEVLADADATRTNPDVTRTRACITVAEAAEVQEREAVHASVAAQFPAVAAFLDEPAECPLYGWCTEHGQHEDHTSPTVALTAPGDTRPYVDARLLSFGPGTELIGFVESDLTPQQALAEASKLRAFAGDVEGLARRLGTGQAVQRPSSHVLGVDAPGHFPWCVPGQCMERRYPDGETLTEHSGREVVLPVPDGMVGAPGTLLSADVYANSDSSSVGLSFNCGGEGVALDSAEAAQVIGSLSAFLEDMRALHAQMAQESAPAEPCGPCGGLGGACVTDHTMPPRLPEDLHCDGARVAMAGACGEEFPEVYLSQWVGEAARVVVDGCRQDLDLDGLDEMLSDLHAYELRLRAMREQLAALEGGAR
ncbi:DUF6907 domain-containing protein [Streptomyces stelliscabiei]|uniref:DUF6907 domain-containing protein n=1 Tax=Streptomyces stelliscabiei TaxID=146820 RepID=UPI0029AEA630|nr:hypothetical protein [Streptomyces stelliscabiei]MDX2639934.1 hypothetical protein [Streptomyces stelliscabiei]MDX2662848.1 hypothetical protein [Streptomyces stelliscabiei]MDX2714514.1 hypothetical protein [Streptomyces stelliscabiei]MDX2792251.1 hypothetical protein [Streptomyces stelliscabiei]